MLRILLLEDEVDLREEVAEYLRGLYYEVEEVGSLREFDEQLSHNRYDIVILDRMLPDGDSLEKVDAFRTKYPSSGVVIFTARDSSQDRICGYRTGADHYVTKPVRLDELAAIVETLSRRVQSTQSWRLNATDWLLITPDNQSIKLTALEYVFLSLLAQNPQKVITRKLILDALNKNQDSYDPRNLDALVLRLRKKTSNVTQIQLPLKTVHSAGYSLSNNIYIY